MRFWQQFGPDKYRFIGQGLLALVITFAVLAPALADRLGYNDPNTQLFAHEFFGKYLAQLSANHLVSLLIIGAFFWVPIGILVYTLTWINANVIVEAQNQATLNRQYTNKPTMATRLKRPLEYLLTGLALLAVALLAVFGLTYWSSLGSQAILTLPDAMAILQLVAVLAGIWLSLLIVSIAWKLSRWVANGRPPLSDLQIG